MDKFSLLYSKKNIPIPSKHSFLQLLVAKTESFIRRIRWKALAFDGKLVPSGKRTFGFRTMNNPPPHPELKKFEEDLMKMIRNIEFRPVKNDLQTQMKVDLNSIKRSGKVIVSADKSLHMYKMYKVDDERHLAQHH